MRSRGEGELVRAIQRFESRVTREGGDQVDLRAGDNEQVWLRVGQVGS